MRRHISTITLTACFCTLLLAMLLINFSFAQGEAAPQEPQLGYIYEVVVKPGMSSLFENVLKSDMIPAMKKAGNMPIFSWKADQFGIAGSYLIASPLGSLAELDSPGSLQKALGQAGLVALVAKLEQLTYNPRMFMVTVRPDLGFEANQDYELKLAIMVKNVIAAGRQADYEKNLKEMLAALKKTNIKGFMTAQVGFGGNPNECLHFAFFDSFADIEKFRPAMQKAMAEAKLTQQTDLSTTVEMTTMSFMPELSIMPTAQ